MTGPGASGTSSGASAPAPPFAVFSASLPAREALRDAITVATRPPEPEALAPLLADARLPPAASAAIVALATRLARTLRERAPRLGRAALVQGLMQEFALSSDEGVALMCVAEALLRIPDADTRQALIRDKIPRGDWQAHLGRSASPFVNAATWGLLVTGRLVGTHSETGLATALARMVARGGEPLIRRGVEIAMRLLGEQFVLGETIAEALAAASEREAQGFRHSFDMLGEAAMTDADARAYCVAYEAAIEAIGAAAGGHGVLVGPGISIKLSALHPRHARAQRERVLAELYPRLRALVLLARSHDVGVNIDAEEADRLELSLDLLERLCAEPGLAGWNGVGFVVQAYQKRCPLVVDWLIDLARRSGHRLMVRLVKGAYWDSEIKRAQVDGLADYPVYTRKVHTDVSYLACARRLLAAPESIYPQFATHNAHTLAAVYRMAGPDYHPGQYEFQCLHGMGEPLYEQVVGPASEGGLGRPCRIYAPVGTHDTLLAYLVRRLLENGANTSFVNQVSVPTVPLERLVADPVRQVEDAAGREGTAGLPHPRIPLPRQLFGDGRLNSAGLDLDDERSLRALANVLAARADAGEAVRVTGAPAAHGFEIRNPALPGDLVGYAEEPAPAALEQALQAAVDAAPLWAAIPPAGRAAVLERAAAALEREMHALIGLIVREAGKTFAGAVAEVREAVDFLRYYAAQVRAGFDDATHRPLGPTVCISPWNFPLAIFTGQVAGALAAGNPVLAKPAEQTPLIAARAIAILHASGVPREVLQLLPGRGETVGATLVADPRVECVMFTGSTEVARVIARTLAGRLGGSGEPVPLIAETGGQNAMIVDSSALAEQVVADVLASAFDSAGQRCSALRVLCLQEEIAPRVLEMLRGAMAELVLGRPDELSVDVGPVIDADAASAIRAHVDAMRAKGCPVWQAWYDGDVATESSVAAREHFVPPTLIEIARVGELAREVFGPVLHVVQWRREALDALVDDINATGYGLTLGIHSRIDETIARVRARARVGNVYVNRNIIGAVVGVQPFGGEGLSGTGPKAGGPLYLLRLLREHPDDAVVRALAAIDAPGVEAALAALADPSSPLSTLRDWCRSPMAAGLAPPNELFDRLATRVPAGALLQLPGPTGERNRYALHARPRILCLADAPAHLVAQLAVVVAVGAHALWPRSETTLGLYERLPPSLQQRIHLDPDWRTAEPGPDAIVHCGDRATLCAIVAWAAERPGALIGVHHHAAGAADLHPERLMLERVTSVNTAAAGGNATLMTIG